MAFNSETAKLAGHKSSRAVSPEVKLLRTVTIEALTPLLLKVSSLNMAEAALLAKSPDAPIIETTLARCWMKAHSEGDMRVIAWMFERLLGKPKETISQNDNSTIEIVIKERITDGERV